MSENGHRTFCRISDARTCRSSDKRALSTDPRLREGEESFWWSRTDPPGETHASNEFCDSGRDMEVPKEEVDSSHSCSPSAF
jgi:hypothetical protein